MFLPRICRTILPAPGPQCKAHTAAERICGTEIRSPQCSRARMARASARPAMICRKRRRACRKSQIFGWKKGSLLQNEHPRTLLEPGAKSRGMLTERAGVLHRRRDYDSDTQFLLRTSGSSRRRCLRTYSSRSPPQAYLTRGAPPEHTRNLKVPEPCGKLQPCRVAQGSQRSLRSLRNSAPCPDSRKNSSRTGSGGTP